MVIGKTGKARGQSFDTNGELDSFQQGIAPREDVYHACGTFTEPSTSPSFEPFGLIAASSLGLPIIGTLLGHTQAATTQRYAHLSADPVRAANETIAQKIAMSAGASNKVVPLVRKK